MARDQHAYLRAIPLFADLTDKELDALERAVTELRLDAGTVVMREGELARDMYVVVEGVLEVTKDGEFIADIPPGGFAGEMALLTHARRNATVTAKTDCRVLHLDGRMFGYVLDEAPHIAVKMLPIVAARVVDLSEHHTD